MIKRLRHLHAAWIREGNFVGATWEAGNLELEVMKDERSWVLRFSDRRRVRSEYPIVARFKSRKAAMQFVDGFDYMIGNQ